MDRLTVAVEICRGAPPGSARRKLAFRLGTLAPARRLGADSQRCRSGAIGPAVVIRAPACTWTEVAAEHSLQTSFGFAMMRRAPQVGAPRHISTAIRSGARVQHGAATSTPETSSSTCVSKGHARPSTPRTQDKHGTGYQLALRELQPQIELRRSVAGSAFFASWPHRQRGASLDLLPYTAPL